MHQPEPAASAETVASLTTRLAAAEQALAARDKTIAALVNREKDRAAKRHSVLDVLEENTELQQVVAHKTLELETQNARLSREVKARNEAEENMRRLQSLQKAILNSAAYGIQGMDAAGRIIFENPASARMLGWEMNDLIGQSAHEIVHHTRADGSAYPVEQCRIQAALHDGRLTSVSDEVFWRKDGTSFPVEYTVAPLRDSADKITGAVVVFTDISARQQAEMALRESEKRFRELFLNSRDAMNTADPATKRFTSGNPATLQLFGVQTEAEFLAHSPASFSPERQSDGRLSADAVKSMIEITLREGSHFFEWTHRRATGEEFPTDVLLTRVEQGGKPMILATIRDITERKRAEAALRASEEKLRQIFEHSVQVFYAHTADGRLTYVSPQAEKYFDCSVAEALQPWTEFLTDNPLNAEGIELTRRAIESGEQQRPYQLELKSKRGRTVWVEVHESPVVVAGKAVGMVGALTDITERKQSEAALKKLHVQLVDASRQAGMAEVATSMLHNIGNVLNSVNISSACVASGLRKSKSANLAKVATLLAGHASDLGAFFTSDPKGRQLPGYLAQLAEHLAGEQEAALKELADLQKNIEHIKDIVNMQQSFAKTSGLAETLPLTDLVEDALKMNASSLARHDIQIIKEFEAMPQVTVEKHKVLQVLVNLVRNAKQACDELDPPEKRLTLRVTGAGDRIRIEVTDNGIGIPSENLTRIFAHGFTTKKTGHGFGLHSGALAAQAMGGSLTVHSDGPGRGATFTLELPCTP